MALLFVFGSPGAGKTYVGRVLHEEFNYYSYEADDDLTEEMIKAIQEERLFTDEMRERYFKIIIKKLSSLIQQHKNVVATQALIKEINRKQILQALPQTQFLHVSADISNITQRLKLRGDWVSIEYANKIRAIFEAPEIPHSNIDNNRDKQHVMQQLQGLLF